MRLLITAVAGSRDDEEAKQLESQDRWLSDFERNERELVTLTTRIPKDLFFEMKLRALRSTIQILSEHAYTLYLGGRLPPDLWGGYEWPEEFPAEPRPAYLSSELRGFSVRIPRTLLRWARVFAAEADISDQELAVRVFDWYVRRRLIPPDRKAVRRNASGRLVVDEPLVADKFWGYSSEQIMEALEIMVARHSRYGGPLANPTGHSSLKGSPPLREKIARPRAKPERVRTKNRRRNSGAPRNRRISDARSRKLRSAL